MWAIWSFFNWSSLDAEDIFRRKKCVIKFEIYNDCQHIKFNTPILGSIGEFCGGFYHVPGNNYHCLDGGSCKVAKMVKESRGEKCPEWIPPKSVVALVKYEIHDGSDIIVRYSNHYVHGGTKHAEEFFSDDIKGLSQNSSISGKKLKKITMYITFQPCHRSTINTPDKSCCDMLLELLNDPRLKGVEMCIKPTRIYKSGSDGSTLVENGKKGIKKLMQRGIEITKMEEADWNFLLNLVDMAESKREDILSGYSEIAGRKDLDEQVSEFLQEILESHGTVSIEAIQPSRPHGGGGGSGAGHGVDDDSRVEHLIGKIQGHKDFSKLQVDTENRIKWNNGFEALQTFIGETIGEGKWTTSVLKFESSDPTANISVTWYTTTKTLCFHGKSIKSLPEKLKAILNSSE